LKIEKEMTRAKHVLSDAEGHAKVHKIPFFPPFAKGEGGGFLDFFARFAPWREKLLEVVLSISQTFPTQGSKRS
jgi:hypothetical protein